MQRSTFSNITVRSLPKHVKGKKSRLSRKKDTPTHSQTSSVCASIVFKFSLIFTAQIHHSESHHTDCDGLNNHILSSHISLVSSSIFQTRDHLSLFFGPICKTLSRAISVRENIVQPRNNQPITKTKRTVKPKENSNRHVPVVFVSKDKTDVVQCTTDRNFFQIEDRDMPLQFLISEYLAGNDPPAGFACWHVQPSWLPLSYQRLLQL